MSFSCHQVLHSLLISPYHYIGGYEHSKVKGEVYKITLSSRVSSVGIGGSSERKGLLRTHALGKSGLAEMGRVL